jgi:type IV pilus assembly protein PilW
MRRAEAGFSLIELMVALVIGLLVVFGATSLFVTMKSSFGRVEALSERQEALRYLADSIMMDVRVSSGVAIDTSGGDLEVRLDIPRRTHGTLYCSDDSSYSIYYSFLDGGDEVRVGRDCNGDGSLDDGYQPIVSGILDFNIEPVYLNRMYKVTVGFPPFSGVLGGGDETVEFHVVRRTPVIEP